MTDTTRHPNRFTMRELAIGSADEIAAKAAGVIQHVKDWDLEATLSDLADLLEDVDAFGASLAQLYTAGTLAGVSYADYIETGEAEGDLLDASLDAKIAAALTKHGVTPAHA